MDVISAINERRCVRKFSERVPDVETVKKLLEAAVRAPSAGNLQPWHFYVVSDKATRSKLSRAALGQKHVALAPMVIVVCADPERSASKYGQRGRELYCIQDCAAATENLLLAAVEMGLVGCWVGAFNEERAARILGAPPGRRPLALIPLGYPARAAKYRTGRIPTDDVSTYL